MRKALFVPIAMCLIPFGASGVDGTVLINQSTVMAAGGFPYMITQPGSYRLSGNLQAPVNTSAIVITGVYVTLDLNGFSINCSANTGTTTICVSDYDPIRNFGGAGRITIANGVISANTPPIAPGVTITAIKMFTGHGSTVRDMLIEAFNNGNILGDAINIFGSCALRRNTIRGNVAVGPVSLVIENVLVAAPNAGGSSLVLNNAI